LNVSFAAALPAATLRYFSEHFLIFGAPKNAKRVTKKQ